MECISEGGQLAAKDRNRGIFLQKLYDYIPTEACEFFFFFYHFPIISTLCSIVHRIHCASYHACDIKAAERECS